MFKVSSPGKHPKSKPRWLTKTIAPMKAVA